MSYLLLAPHNDDETLWCSWTIMRYQPHVVVVYKSAKQMRHGITASQREHETGSALSLLSPASTWEQWPILDTVGEAEGRQAVRVLMELMVGIYDHVFAPASEEGGHEQHNTVGELALEVFGADNVTQYLTYRRGFDRSRSEWEVPFEPEWPSTKLIAMSCYLSQIALPDTAPWFVDSTLREYYTHPPKAALPVKSEEEFWAEHGEQIAVAGELRSRL